MVSLEVCGLVYTRFCRERDRLREGNVQRRERRGSGRTVVAVLACAVLTSAGGPLKAQQCDITITAPKPRESVGAIGTAKGKAYIPSKGHLWILAHRVGRGDWWPQGQGPTTLDNGTWEVAVSYGEARDIGSEFEVAAAAVGETDNQKLLRWVAEAPAKGHPGTQFPNTISGCPVRKVRVLKTSH